MVSDYARYKCPNPAYVFYKYEKDWQRVEFKVFPSDISKANLSPSVDGDQYVMAAKGTMTAEDVRYLLATVNKHKRAIDPNRRSPDSCEKTRFLD